ncbi:MAG: response regulator [Anaerolineae bacterium]|nr:response regulator [Anaerolineae bacterium]
MSEPLILIVDDEPGLVRLFANIIESRLHYRTLQAIEGEEALRILEQETPRLMLLDIAMPMMDGIEVVRRIRQNARWGDLKIIVLTARPRGAYEEAEELGVDAWISKPVMPMVLVDAIQTVLSDDAATSDGSDPQ